MRLVLYVQKTLHKGGFYGEHLLANGELNTNVLSCFVDPTNLAFAEGFVDDENALLNLGVIKCRGLRFCGIGLCLSNRRLNAVCGSNQIWLLFRFGLGLGSDRSGRHFSFPRLRSNHREGGNFLGSLHGCLLIVEQSLVLFTLDNSVPTTDPIL